MVVQIIAYTHIIAHYKSLYMCMLGVV